MKFITDITLGKLTKWLRILGYDTEFIHRPCDQTLIEYAERQNRLILTRKGDIEAKQCPGRIVVIKHDKVSDQIGEVGTKISLSFEQGQWFTRCLRCNEELTAISREEAAGSIPEYVLDNSKTFNRCPSCQRIFWPGSHKQHMESILKKHIRPRLP